MEDQYAFSANDSVGYKNISDVKLHLQIFVHFCKEMWRCCIPTDKTNSFNLFISFLIKMKDKKELNKSHNKYCIA